MRSINAHSTALRMLLGYVVIFASLNLNGCCKEKDIPKFNHALYSAVAKERNEAALQLARCGESASGSVPKLAELLYDDNAGVQSSASYALREIDTPAAQRAIQEAQKNRGRK